ncbi:MAG: glpQ, partial [Methanomicrobia archaeon]|nr:glpQ [Methanomicrobia archaeon]
AARAMLPGLATGLIVSRTEVNPVEMATRAGAGTLLPRKDLLSEELVQAARRVRVRVIPWTLNTGDDIRRAMELDVDGFATDDPCSAREWVKGMRD